MLKYWNKILLQLFIISIFKVKHTKHFITRGGSSSLTGIKLIFLVTSWSRNMIIICIKTWFQISSERLIKLISQRERRYYFIAWFLRLNGSRIRNCHVLFQTIMQFCNMWERFWRTIQEPRHGFVKTKMWLSTTMIRPETVCKQSHISSHVTCM